MKKKEKKIFLMNIFAVGCRYKTHYSACEKGMFFLLLVYYLERPIELCSSLLFLPLSLTVGGSVAIRDGDEENVLLHKSSSTVLTTVKTVSMIYRCNVCSLHQKSEEKKKQYHIISIIDSCYAKEQIVFSGAPRQPSDCTCL